MKSDMIRAWKRWEDKETKEVGLISCDLEDPECVRWEVTGPGSPHWSPITCKSLYEAQKVEDALTKAFEAGKKAAMADLRRFIGIS